MNRRRTEDWRLSQGRIQPLKHSLAITRACLSCAVFSKQITFSHGIFISRTGSNQSALEDEATLCQLCSSPFTQVGARPSTAKLIVPAFWSATPRKTQGNSNKANGIQGIASNCATIDIHWRKREEHACAKVGAPSLGTISLVRGKKCRIECSAVGRTGKKRRGTGTRLDNNECGRQSKRRVF